MNRGKISQGRIQFEKALWLNPNYAEALSNAGYALSQEGANGQALPLIDRALTLEPYSSKIQENRGRVLEQLGQMREALPAWQFVVNSNPQDDVARNHLGRALAEVGDSQGAAVQFGIASQLAPNNTFYKFNYAMMLKKSGRYEQARAALGDLLRRDPHFTEAQTELNRLPASSNQ